jgi:hypothetical protein
MFDNLIFNNIAIQLYFNHDIQTLVSLSRSKKELNFIANIYINKYKINAQQFTNLLNDTKINLIEYSRDFFQGPFNNLVIKLNSIIRYRNNYFDQNKQLFKDIQVEIFQCIRHNNIPNNHKQDLILLRDRLFIPRYRQEIIEPSKVTKLFNDFIKGITVFSSLSQPIYHRRRSCSSRGSPSNRTKEKEIERCYIERLIYDELWEKYTQSFQDQNHLNWLEDTTNAYQTCYPNTVIKIRINYKFENLNTVDSFEMPYKLEIQWLENNNSKKYESYVKENGIIECSKFDENQTPYYKQNTEQIENPWILGTNNIINTHFYIMFLLVI